jgi:glycosyltransferase involved in cell wall biosynthesis
MRIVYLTTCAPEPPDSGHSLRVNALWQALRRRGAVRVYAIDARPPLEERRRALAKDIHALAPRRETKAGVLAGHLRAFLAREGMIYAKALSPRRIARLREAVRDLGTDLVVVGDTWLAHLARPLAGCARHIVVDTHNVESRLWRSILAEQPWASRPKAFLFWRNVCALERRLKEVDAVWAVSAADAALYRTRLRLPRVAILPNAVDTDAYAPVAGADTALPGLIVFTGSYGYWPNNAAALHLIEVARRLGAAGVPHRVQLVGRDPTDAMRAAAAGVPSVEITGAVADIRPYIARAALVAAPLSSGSGPKYKSLQALASGRPVVTTPVGAEGLDLLDGRDAAIATDLDDLTRRVQELLADPGRAERMGHAGRDWVVATHSFGALDTALAAALDALERSPRSS